MGTLYDSALKSIGRDKEEERKSFFKPIDDTRITFPTPEKTTGSLYEEALNSLDYDEEQLKDTRTKYQYSADLLKDILIQPVGGVVDAAESIANLALPKENEIEISDWIPEAKTGAGQFVRIGSQFLIPYTGAYKVARGGYLFVKNGKNLKKVLEANDKNLKKALETGNKVKRTYKKKDGSITIVQQGAKIRQTKTESLVDLARKSIGKDKIVKPKFRKDTKKLFTPEKFKATTGLSKKQAIGIGVGAGALTDAIAFAPEDPNLADLFVQFPATKFAVAEWLATDPNGDPGMERLKNVVAGLIPSAFIPLFMKGVAKGFNWSTKPITKLSDEAVDKKRLAKTKAEIELKTKKKKVTKKDKIDIDSYVNKQLTTAERVAVKWREGFVFKKQIIKYLDGVRGFEYLKRDAIKNKVKGIKGVGKDAKELSAYQEARFLPAIGGMIEHFLTKRTFRFKDGVFVDTGKDGLQELLKNNLAKNTNINDFFNYAGAKSLMALRKTDKDVYNKLLKKPEDRKFWSDLAKKGDADSNYVKTLKELDRFNKDLLQIAVDSQLISAKTMAKLIAKRKPYMPLYRDISMDEMLMKKAGGGKLMTGLKGYPIGKGEGELPLAPFFDNYIENVEGIITSSYKNHIKRNTFDIIDTADAQGKALIEYAEEIPQKTPPKPVKVSKKELKQKLKKQETSIDINDLDDIDDIVLFRSENVKLADDQEYVIRTNEKGESVKHIYQINNPLLKLSLDAVSPKQFNHMNAIVKGARWWKNLLTKGVTYDPGFFAGANFVRDTVSAAILSKNVFHLPFLSTLFNQSLKFKSNVRIKMADGTFMTRKELLEEFLLNGGSFGSTLLKGETSEALLKNLYRKMGHSDYQNVLNTPRKYLDWYENVITGFENASRFTEYTLLRKAGRSARQAAFEAREVAVDFGMHGAANWFRQYTSTVPFLNAGLQGLYRTGRAFGKGSTERTAVATKMVAFVGVPTLAMYILNRNNKDYWNQSQQIRDLNFMLPLPEILGGKKGDWIKIAKPFEFGAIGTIGESLLKTFDDTGNADAFFNTAWTVIKHQTRLSVVPQVISPIWNTYLNKTFFGSPVISQALKNNVPDYGQSYPWSNKALTSAIENAPLWLQKSGLLMSPVQFENYFRAYSGTIGSYVLDLLDTGSDLFSDNELPDWRLDQFPLVKRFLQLDPASYTQAEQEFYELKAYVNKTAGLAKKYEKERKIKLLERFVSDPENIELLNLRDDMENWGRQIQALLKQRDDLYTLPKDVMDGAQKADIADELEREAAMLFDNIMTSLENMDLEIFKPIFKTPTLK